MVQTEGQKNMKALGLTVFVYSLLIVICILVGFTTPPPLPNQDLGMEVNLGNSPEGTGQVQPLNPNPPAETHTAPVHAQASPASNRTGAEHEQIATQDETDAPVIRQPKEEKKTVEFSRVLDEKTKRERHPRPDAPVEPKPAPPRPKAIYSGGSSSNANSGNNSQLSNDSRGEGLTGKAGDQGAVNGNPLATNHNGAISGLGGNGLSYRLTGREIVQYPSREGDFNEPGRVRMKIKVDQQGNIIESSIISADNPVIGRLAEKKIKQIKFNDDPGAPVVQFGEIVFVFRLQKQ